MRAFRPSQYAPLDDGQLEDPVVAETRQQNVLLYAKRAEAEAPLFEDGPKPPQTGTGK